MKHFLIISGFMLAFFSLKSQDRSLVTITGRVVEEGSSAPVEFATVMLVDSTSQKMLEGATTDENGTFLLRSPSRGYRIVVSFIGFESRTLAPVPIVNGRMDFGDIPLSNQSTELEEVTVRGEKSRTEFKLDKRVFNVGKDLASTGASALEVLNNVPSVNVNIEGQISLRGNSGVQILIDGKPSVIASEQGNSLGTITAEMIEKIEVITNPSAKYDAEGTSGIINIVMKKEEKKGLNGSVTVNVGLPENNSLGLSLNRRTDRFNLFSQLGVGRRSLPRYGQNKRVDLQSGSTLVSEGVNYRNETFYNVILGSDFHINRYNVLTLSGNFAYEIEDQPSETDFVLSDSLQAETTQWRREETTEAINPKFQFELQYKKDFKDHKEHDLLLGAIGHFFYKDQSSVFNDIYDQIPDVNDDQQTRTKFGEAKYTFKLDYTRPFSKQWSMETGMQYVLNIVENDYGVSDFVNGGWVEVAELTNLFQYDQRVSALYGTGSYEGARVGIKLGLRLEHTDLKTLLTNTNRDDRQNYLDLFPTLHATYKWTERFSIQGGYSRRIWRPRLWDLNPFFNVRDNYNVWTGNPELLPTYSDSYELTSIYLLEKASMNLGVYHIYTTDEVERVTTFEDGVSTTRPLNIGSNASTGMEYNFKYTPLKSLSFNGDFNFGYFNRKGSYEAQNFDFQGSKWSSKLTAKSDLPMDFEVEVTGQYESSYKTVQGSNEDQLFANIGLRKKVLKGRLIFSLSVRDVFDSRRRVSVTDEDRFYLVSRSRRGRFFALGVSYGFGRGEAMEFTGRRHYH